MLKRKKFFKKVTIFLIAFTFLLFPYKFSLNALNDNNSGSEKYDYVLIIDESGSMRTNDPSNMRVDAARLFIYLNEMLSKGNRVLIAGFGEKTNIYLPLTEITGNEDAINAAIEMIQSNQNYTDMKGALADIKKILGQRIVKQKTAVIFLTDGALTINDIPPEATEDQKVKDGKEKPGRTKTGGDSQNENPGSITGQQGEDSQGNNGTDKIGSTGKGENQYLAKYKKELLDLCYSYKRDNIVIYPVAFTKEAETGLLEQMASITSGAFWRAEKASDIRNIFLEILKNITSRFLRIEEQKDNSAISGEFEITKDVKELVLIATASNFEPNPKINVISPSSEKPVFDKVVEQKGFKIVQVSSPEEGKWSYEINGDGVFVYDIVSSNIIEPSYPIYLSDTSIPFQIKLGDTLEDSSSLKSDDFEITFSVKGPEGGASVDGVNLSDDGKGMDDLEGDGVFSGVFNKTDIKGNYNAVFSMQHIPTNSTSTKKINFEVIKLPVIFKVLEPAGSFYISGKKIPIKVQLTSDPGTDSKDEINFAEYQITCTIFYPDGKKTEGLMLLDNGQSSDEKSGDGIFSAAVIDSSLKGDYSIKFYIQHIPTMNASANTANIVKFKVAEISEIEARIETSPVTGEPAKITANFLDFSKSSFKYILTKPGGAVVESEMSDSGESKDADSKKDDGIYSAVLEKLDELGEYKLLIKSSYSAASSDSVSSESIPVEKELKFNKEYKVVAAFAEVPLEINSTEEEVKFSLRIISKSSSESVVSIDENKLKSEPLSSLESLIIETGTEKIKPNSDNEVKFILKLKENSKAGKHSFKIPLVIDGKYPTDADINIELAASFPWYLKIIVIGMSVLAAAAIFLFVYFLYIKPKKANF
ncbi:MAG: VWA domain-containing protein [Actinobacteria bacterium]|nr:VWA domain-containing protein [Actinomycetota bacterium]